ncbi:hypothetical protein DFH09DRAFT_1073263 [Mycena vulgaris]|nr:hypothetical protein DFH09DRAFT_1073263 [Mycena vulgaris]
MPGSYTLGAEWRAAVFLLCAPRHMQRTAPREWNDRTITRDTWRAKRPRGDRRASALLSSLPFTARQPSLFSDVFVHYRRRRDSDGTLLRLEIVFVETPPLDESCNLLNLTAGALLDVSELTLMESGFKVGHIAEVGWAVKDVGDEGNTITMWGEKLPDLFGGRGGVGGQIGGDGGLDEAPSLAAEDAHSFYEIWG